MAVGILSCSKMNIDGKRERGTNIIGSNRANSTPMFIIKANAMGTANNHHDREALLKK